MCFVTVNTCARAVLDKACRFTSSNALAAFDNGLHTKPCVRRCEFSKQKKNCGKQVIFCYFQKFTSRLNDAGRMDINAIKDIFGTSNASLKMHIGALGFFFRHTHVIAPICAGV